MTLAPHVARFVVMLAPVPTRSYLLPSYKHRPLKATMPSVHRRAGGDELNSSNGRFILTAVLIDGPKRPSELRLLQRIVDCLLYFQQKNNQK